MTSALTKEDVSAVGSIYCKCWQAGSLFGYFRWQILARVHADEYMLVCLFASALARMLAVASQIRIISLL